MAVEKTKTVTVVTPSYNQGRFIEETIKSVISQEGNFYLEYLIMDGGSKDETVGIIKKYEDILKKGNWPVRCKGIDFKWVSEKDKGQADAVNKGFRAAKGEMLGWLNSDDTYINGAIAKALNYFTEHPDSMMVYGEAYKIKDTGEIIERYYTEPFDFKKLAEVCFICQPSVFLRKEVVEAVGLLDPELHYCMDYEYWIRIAKKFKIGYLPEFLANTRIYLETKTMSKRLEVHNEIVKTIKAHYGYVPALWKLSYIDAKVERLLGGKNDLKNSCYSRFRDIIVRYKNIISKH
ncbi:MAG: glycosyltransferase [Deltaproteobacteria bacterium]|nr:glycosyltransferase [Deltaproteobacteria bacterium]